jgi:hypothetical protein
MPSAIVTATVQATALASTSNILAQLIDAHRKHQPLGLDLGQFVRFFILTIITTPPNYCWQALLERTFPARDRSQARHDHDDDIDLENQRKQDADNLLAGDPMAAQNSASGSLSTFSRLSRSSPTAGLNYRNTALKWFIDCITLGAIMNTVAFLVLMGLLKHHSWAQIGTSLREETWPIIRAGYVIWPVASIISFAFVPVEKRIVWLSFVGLMWGIYMSLVAAEI